MRLSALWTPSENFRALWVADADFDDSQVPSYMPTGYRNDNGSCAVPQVAGFNGGTGCPVYAAVTPNSAPVAVAYGGTDPTIAFGANSYGDRNDSHMYGGSLRLDWTLAGATLTSVTGARKMDRTWGSGSGSPYIDQDILGIENLKTFSQEVRLASNGASALRWLVGAYYSRDSVADLTDYNFAQNYEIASLSPAPIVFFNNVSQITQSEAVFAHVEYALSRKWKLIVGARETHDGINYTYSSGANAIFAPEDELTPVPYDHATLSSNGPTGKLGLDFQPSDNLLLYLSASEGYKCGGFPGAIAFLPYPATEPASAYLPSYGSEKLFAYEAGAKATLADDALVLDSSIFYYDWRNMQATTEIPYGTAPNVIEVFSLGNAGDVRIYGLDEDLNWRMTREWSLRAALNLMDSRIVTGIYKGEVPVQAPKESGNLALRYQSAHRVVGELPFVQVDYSYRTSVYFTLPNVAADSQPGYGLLGLRAGAMTYDGKWQWSLWVRNLANKAYLVDAFGAASTFLADRHLEAVPRTFGLNVRYTY